MMMEAALSAATVNSPSFNPSNYSSGGNPPPPSQQQLVKEFKWYNAYSLPMELQCNVLRLEFPESFRLSADFLPEDLSVTLQIFCNQLPIFDPPINTLFSSTNEAMNYLSWDYNAIFPIKIKDLSLDSLLVMTILTADQRIIGGTSMRLFDEEGCFKQGKQKLLFFPSSSTQAGGDNNVVYAENKTPGEYYNSFASYDGEFQFEKTSELFYKRNTLPNHPIVISNSYNNNTNDNIRKEWLDNLMIKRLNQINLLKPSFNKSNSSSSNSANSLNNDENEIIQKYYESFISSLSSLEELEIKSFFYLIIELPTFSFPLFYEDKQYPSVDPHLPPTSLVDLLKDCIIENHIPSNQQSNSNNNPNSGSVATGGGNGNGNGNGQQVDDTWIEFQLTGRHFNPTWLTVVADWDMDQENLFEEQNRRLSHNVRKGGSADSTVKPNKEEKIRIDKIISSVNQTTMLSNDMDFLYRFRYSLTENKKALIKFLYCLNWDDDNEINELPILLALWKERSPIDVADALKLLSKDKSFEHPIVREYAVDILRSASDEELLTFLLQLVQALRYEPTALAPSSSSSSSSSGSGGHHTVAGNAQAVMLTSPAVAAAVSSITKGSTTTSTAVALTTAAMNNISLANDTVGNNIPEATAIPFPSSASSSSKNNTSSSASSSLSDGDSSPLGNFLIDRACRSPVVANYLYWYVKVEMEGDVTNENEHTSLELYNSIFQSFTTRLATYSEETKSWFKRLMTADEYINNILLCQAEAIKEGKRRDGKEVILRINLEKKKLNYLPGKLDWIPLPLEPNVKINGLIPSTVVMFASAVYPCVFEFTDYQTLLSSSAGNDSSLPPPAVSSAESGSQQHPPVPPSVPVPAIAAVKTHKVMFKSGDDLRQDQLVMQMISLMDSLLKKVNLDLKLVTYGILAVSKKDGLMEFVRNSSAISSVLKNGTILDFLRQYNYDRNGPFEITKK
jgi:hypothetical protein